jgi:hypothetical protein
MDLPGFGETAKGLAKNPLGIIALFIVLVYGIASIVLGVSAKSLGDDHKTILVCFLALFPFAVLFTFAWMVANHHSKLYAPTDYRTDESFWQSLSPETQRARLQEEVQAVAAQEPIPEPDNAGISTAAMDASRKTDLRGRVLVSEELALREIESEFSVSVNRQFSVRGIEFDGIFAKGGRGYGVEVKYVRGSRIKVASLCQQLNVVVSSMAGYGWRNFGIILALVVEELEGDELQKQVDSLREALAKLDGPMDLRVYNFAELREKYGV